MPWNSMVMLTPLRQREYLIDCLNGRNMQEHFKRRKPNLRPYYSSEDDRLEEDFWGDLEAWEKNVDSRDVPEGEKSMMCLSKETQEGLKLTVNSFVGVTKYLLTLPGVEGQYMLSECFSQDPLENYFGQIRARGESDSENFTRICTVTTCARITCLTANTNLVLLNPEKGHGKSMNGHPHVYNILEKFSSVISRESVLHRTYTSSSFMIDVLLWHQCSTNGWEAELELEFQLKSMLGCTPRNWRILHHPQSYGKGIQHNYSLALDVFFFMNAFFNFRATNPPANLIAASSSPDITAHSFVVLGHS